MFIISHQHQMKRSETFFLISPLRVTVLLDRISTYGIANGLKLHSHYDHRIAENKISNLTGTVQCTRVEIRILLLSLFPKTRLFLQIETAHSLKPDKFRLVNHYPSI